VNEEEYYATELTDAEIDALADAGDYFLEMEGNDSDAGLYQAWIDRELRGWRNRA